MARIPNKHSDATVESLIRDVLHRGNIPLVCEGDDCLAVTGLSPKVALRERDEPHNVIGACENCGGHFQVADLTGPVEE